MASTHFQNDKPSSVAMNLTNSNFLLLPWHPLRTSLFGFCQAFDSSSFAISPVIASGSVCGPSLCPRKVGVSKRNFD